MKVTLPDGSVKEFVQSAVTPYDVAASIGAGLAKAAIGAKVDGRLWDLHRPLPGDCTLSIITQPKLDKDGRTKGEHNPEALYLLRHSCAHIMAEAICKLFPKAQLAYGPPLDNGFYYDIALDTPIRADDFPRIEDEMKKIVAQNRKFMRYELPFEQGFQKLRAEGNKYKLDNAQRAQQGGATSLSWYINGEPYETVIDGNEYWKLSDVGSLFDRKKTIGNTISTNQGYMHNRSYSVSAKYAFGEGKYFEDLCMGPHVPSTGVVGAFKIMSVASSHWHGDVNSDRFQRIYGTAFFSQADLDHHLAQLEEARQRDHREVGKKLGLFLIDEMVGQGLVLWKPRGAMVRSLLQQFLQEELLKRGYQMVFTPHIGKIDLYKTSGHYPYYADAQFPTIKMKDHPNSLAEVQKGGSADEEEYLLKPMNCPHHIRIFASDKHSYRDLPIRMAEFGTVYRYEQSGELTGMTRVRGFTQDDAHLFCTEDQVKAEFRATIELVQFVFATFGFPEVTIRLSLRDPESTKYSGRPEVWERAERELREVLTDMGVAFVEAKGEAAFYGPKVDFIVKDVIGRKWQLGTVQLDYNLPERFKLEYIGADNQAHQPVMIHRAPFGSMERFMAILIEHYAGAFPLWLAPEQVRVLPISDKFNGYGQKVGAALKAAGLRVTVDESGERVNAKIKVAQDLKTPYMLVVGGKDEAAGHVSVRCRSRGDLGALPLEAFVHKAREEIDSHGKAVVNV